MLVESQSIPEVKMIRPDKHGDERGFFSETYNKRDLAACGIETEFVQDGHSLSAPKGTVRGLHFQIPPFAQDKIVRVIRGSILDVAVDIRKGSPTYGEHVAVELSAGNWSQLFIPVGFAHGFCTLEDNCEVLYKMSNFYSGEHDRGLLWNDPGLGINWPVAQGEAMLSAKDGVYPTLNDLPGYFSY